MPLAAGRVHIPIVTAGVMLPLSLPSLPLEPSIALPVVTSTSSRLGVPGAEIEPAGLFTVSHCDLRKLRY